jgi:Phage integrase, N-terminal SAM-like domain
MASAEKRVRNGRARWYARYRTPDGQQRTRTFARKVDADHFLVEIAASKQRGSFVDPRRASPTVGDWADDWLAAQADLSPTTRNRYEGIITRHIRPRWGRVRLGDVTTCAGAALAYRTPSGTGQRKEGAPGALDGAGVRRIGRPAGGQPCGRRKPAARPGGRQTVPEPSAGSRTS